MRPELVVEIALDGVQASTRYPGGVALRFARVKRYRPDKDAAEADTIERSRRCCPHARRVAAVGARWEWRTFGRPRGERAGRARARPVQESDEVYVLSPAGNASVKFRDGVIDVKTLSR